MGKRKERNVAEELRLQREILSLYEEGDDRLMHRIERDLFRLKSALSRGLDRKRPNVKWLGERLVWRRKLCDRYWELSGGRGLYPEDQCFF